MKKEKTTMSMGRKCRLCKQEIFVTIYQDEDGFFVSEKCGCEDKGFPPRRHACDIPEYATELKRRIAAAQEILEELTKYIG